MQQTAELQKELQVLLHTVIKRGSFRSTDAAVLLLLTHNRYERATHLPYVQISHFLRAKPHFLGVPGETAFRSYTARDSTINRALLNSEDEGGGLHPGHTGHKGLIVYST